MKNIKVFLGGFTNFTNAQNLNCRALSVYLDKGKFDVYTLELSSGQLKTVKDYAVVNIFYCFKPARFSIYIGFLWGIWNCDVAYLPKGELWRFNRFLLKILKKKSFSTIEGILDQDNLDSAIECLGNYENVLESKQFFDGNYAITHFLGQYNYDQHKISVEPQPLYLGCDASDFINNNAKSGILKNVVYIGRLKRRKGIYDFLNIAQGFPSLMFYIFGGGEELAAIESYISENKLNHVKLMGVVSHATLATYLKETDLHILPSRSEGFPKVTLETAAAGVPSIVYDDYGAQEWITNGVNGWVVKDVEDIVEIIHDLKNNPQKLLTASNEAINLAKSFDWKVKVKEWEKVIEKLYDEYV